MVEKDVAYFAGFFDGEGSVSINRGFAKKKNWSPTHSLTVQISGSRIEPLKKLYDIFGGSLFTTCSNVWKWCLTGNKAAEFIELIYPYSLIKKEEIELALQFQKDCVRHYGEYTPREKTPKDLIQKRDKYRTDLIQLNKN